MRKHPLLAFVTAIVTCSIPSTITAARADTVNVKNVAKTASAVAATKQPKHKSRTFALTKAESAARTKSRRTHEARLEVEQRVRERRAHQVRLEAVARARARHARLARAEAAARAKARAAAAQASVARAKARPRAVVHPYAALGGVWLSLRSCESHNNYAENTGNGYYGAYQFTTSSWHAVGENGLPSEASPQVQDAAARALFSRQGWHAWPVCSWKAGLA